MIRKQESISLRSLFLWFDLVPCRCCQCLLSSLTAGNSILKWNQLTEWRTATRDGLGQTYSIICDYQFFETNKRSLNVSHPKKEAKLKKLKLSLCLIN
jgi:hypothetical protein